jgi:perosamine synthetase
MSVNKPELDLAQIVAGRLDRFLRGAGAQLHAPVFNGNEKQYLINCIDSTFVSSVGEYVTKFEEAICGITGSRNAIATVNGTAALHLSLLGIGINPNDEVLVPNLTFAATANAVVYCGAVPHFVDADEENLGMNFSKLSSYLKLTSQKDGKILRNKSTGRVIRAIIPMHTFGHPADMRAAQGLAEEFNLEVIEDSAESLGSTFNGRHTGTFGKVGVLSFNGNKIVTTGGGGCIVTDDDELASRLRHLGSTARVKHGWKIFHDMVGYNYRMPNLNAALGLAQLENLDEKLSSKRKLFEAYKDLFEDVDGVEIFTEPKFSHSNYWLQTLKLEEPSRKILEQIIDCCQMKGIQVRPVWELLNSLPQFSDSPSMDTSISSILSEKILNIPSSPGIV